MKRISLLVLVLFTILTVFKPAQAEPTKEFLRSCTYGVLAGTLVGAASLAFTDQPGENLRNIARGASIGLYTGILLGLYVVYVIPSQLEAEQEIPAEELPPEVPAGGEGGEVYPDEEGYYEDGAKIHWPMLHPIVTQRGVEGVGVALTATF
jgi:hypothetical protein